MTFLSGRALARAPVGFHAAHDVQVVADQHGAVLPVGGHGCPLPLRALHGVAGLAPQLLVAYHLRPLLKLKRFKEEIIIQVADIYP